MESILIIAPHSKLAETAKVVARKHSDVAVKLGLLEQSIDIAQKAEAKGVDVLISRGGTAQLLDREIKSTPTVELPVSPYDLLKAIHRAKTYGNHITVIGFDSIIQGVEQLASILDVNITAHHIENELEGKVYIKRALENGQKIDVLLGGAVAENLAKELGIPTVLLETGEPAIEKSIREAHRIIELRNQERQKAKEFQAILHYINQGVIAVNRQSEITIFNPAANKITGIRQPNILGKRIDQIFPDSRIPKVMEKNTTELGQLAKIGATMTLANRIPIVVKGQTVGAVETFEDVTIIQEYEQKIRFNLLKKGHIAKYTLADIIGESRALKQSKMLARKYAAVESTVLIAGESGTGKEMFAQSIHNLSGRKNDPFVAINCATIPESLLESELFGYEEGAFTGARKKGKAGLFTVAHKGTIFLDEITEMPTRLQARLLRVIQEKEVIPLGSEKIIPIDIRVIAATNKDLTEEVKNGNFRRDLYFRLSILNLKIPPLIARNGDFPMLAEHFIKIYNKKLGKNLTLNKKAILLLENYAWPGNIRELENVIERLCVISETKIREQDVRGIIDELIMHEGNSDSSIGKITQAHVLKTLASCNGNRSLTARQLGISRSSLWRRLREPGV
ncbi:MAG: sigma 54-interacting transcriptional regulator [Deltaproteobacteria bacterium]|nr:sigma 54-interacting transcriptional regulator [Deltaproteobacteria bacterium]